MFKAVRLGTVSPPSPTWNQEERVEEEARNRTQAHPFHTVGGNSIGAPKIRRKKIVHL